MIQLVSIIIRLGYGFGLALGDMQQQYHQLIHDIEKTGMVYIDKLWSRNN